MKTDLHIHTSYSYDSTASPKKMVDAALRKGINCMAITDHNEVKGSLEAAEYAKERPILIIPGIEIKSREGDILGLNIKRIIPSGLSAKETIEKIKEEGGLAIIPHPFGWICSFKGDLMSLLKEIDGIEVLNASIFGPGNKKALNLSEKYNLPFTAGSDAHESNMVGKVYLEIPGDNLSIEEILNQIKNKNVKAGGLKVNFFKRAIAHLSRNIAKIQNYACGKQRKIQ